MKSFTLGALALFAILAPTLAAAEPQARMVYRHELRTMVPVYPKAEAAPPASVSARIARHQTMARMTRVSGARGTGTAALHCDRLIAELRSSEVSR
jgi:hypothetical protein